MTFTLTSLDDSQAFVRRHIGPDAEQQKQMLAALKLRSLDELIEQTVPTDILLATAPETVSAVNENQALAELKVLAQQNKIFKNFIGMGYTATITPPVILRNVLENPGWYTAYTPYQPEVSQGRLEALLNFQQLTLDLTGLDVASASLLDEATAAAEAMAMSARLSKRKGANRFFVSADTHPQTLDVLKTRAEGFGFTLTIGALAETEQYDDLFGVLVQYPTSSGNIADYREQFARWQAQNIIISVAADMLALVLLESPGALGADIVFGSA
ncbi:MAG: glycine dehydrogenase (aminomethyl-transferring), partial [Plesiomonas sp.]